MSRACTVLVVLCALFSSACRDCETDERVLNAYREAIVFPERFQTYMDTHRGEFNGSFYDCMDTCGRQIDSYVVGQEKFCEEVHAGDPDFLNACLHDLDPFRLAGNNVDALRDILKSGAAYSATTLFAITSAQKAADPSGYVSLNNHVIDIETPLLTCRRCRHSILGLKF